MSAQDDAYPLATLAELSGGGPIVVLAPHPDDEALGCGGLLAAAFAFGAGGHVVCLTDGGASHPGSSEWPPARLAARRRAELRQAVIMLGGAPGDVTFLGHADGRLGEIDASSAAGEIAELCDRLRASAIFATSAEDGHPDHKAAARIGCEAQALRSHLRLWFYPIWSRWDDPGFADAHASLRVRRFDTGPWRDVKRRAIGAHASQLGQVVADAPAGFVLDPDMVRMFVTGPELFFETPRCR